jgi:hypothetical protein
MKRTSAAILLAAVAVGLLAGGAQAGTISGSFEGNGDLTPTGMPGVFVQHFTGEGDDTTLGPFTIGSQSTVDFSHPPLLLVTNGMVSLNFADGTLFGTSSGMGTADGRGHATFEADLVFTGGTGRFAGAMGEATITGTIDRTGPTTDTVSASYVGTLSVVPEPGSLTLFALGATTGIGVLARARGKKKQ